MGDAIVVGGRLPRKMFVDVSTHDVHDVRSKAIQVWEIGARSRESRLCHPAIAGSPTLWILLGGEMNNARVSRVPLLVLVLLSTWANASYQIVLGETCSLLSNSSALFGTILPCGQYKTIDAAELTCLSPVEQNDATVRLSPAGWKLTDTATGPALTKQFLFADFQHAFLFMSQTAQLAETNQHHPLWTNLYNSVDVTLNSDDKKCLSNYDVDLAEGMDILFKGF